MDRLAARDVSSPDDRSAIPDAATTLFLSALNQVCNAEVYVKHETHSPVGSFKREALWRPWPPGPT